MLHSAIMCETKGECNAEMGIDFSWKLDVIQLKKKVTVSQRRKNLEVDFELIQGRKNSVMWINSSDSFASLVDVINKGYSGFVCECV